MELPGRADSNRRVRPAKAVRLPLRYVRALPRQYTKVLRHCARISRVRPARSGR